MTNPSNAGEPAESAATRAARADRLDRTFQRALELLHPIDQPHDVLKMAEQLGDKELAEQVQKAIFALGDVVSALQLRGNEQRLARFDRFVEALAEAGLQMDLRAAIVLPGDAACGRAVYFDSLEGFVQMPEGGWVALVDVVDDPDALDPRTEPRAIECAPCGTVRWASAETMARARSMLTETTAQAPAPTTAPKATYDSLKEVVAAIEAGAFKATLMIDNDEMYVLDGVGTVYTIDSGPSDSMLKMFKNAGATIEYV